MSIDQKMLPSKTCTLKPKDQERNSLARQKILQTITVALHQKNVSLPPPMPRLSGGHDLPRSCWNKAPDSPIREYQTGLSRDLGLLPDLGVMSVISTPHWCDIRGCPPGLSTGVTDIG